MSINYNIPNPIQSVTEGMQIGNALNATEAANIDRRMALKKQQAIQDDLAALAAKEFPTAKDFADITIRHPQFNKQFEQAWGMLGEEQKNNRIGQASEVYAALDAGANDVAKNLLEEQAVAAENSNDPRTAKAARTMSEMIKINPKTAKTSVALRLSSLMGPGEFTNTFTKLENSRRAQQLETSDLSKAESDAFKASVAANFAESNAALDLQRKGWDITKIQSDIAFKKENQGIAAVNAQLERESNQIKRDALSAKREEMQSKRDKEVLSRAAEVEDVRGNIDNLLNTVDRVLQLPAGTLEDATGAWDGSFIGGVIDTFDQDVQDFKALMENVDAQSFLSQIPQMRGFGALSDNEGKKLSRALQSFNTKQSTQQFMFNLKEAQRLMMKARSNLAIKYGVPDSIPDTPAAQPSPEEIGDLLKKYGS